MKLQVDATNKQISVEAPINLKELLAELDLLFPDFRLWKDSWNILIVAPATITWQPNLPEWRPYTGGIGDTVVYPSPLNPTWFNSTTNQNGNNHLHNVQSDPTNPSVFQFRTTPG